jgi:hypothetical protein
MAIPIIPKSEVRIDHNIIVGYGEVPSVNIEGRLGWGLPGGEVVYCEKQAREYAAQLDKAIRENLRDPKRLLH